MQVIFYGGALLDTWDILKAECMSCRACSLCSVRTNLVFGVGNPESSLMLIGEAPGEQEDLQGVPFVGPAGKLLDDMLEIIDLDRTKIYIANILKCRPPRNRDPQPQEMSACRPWLDRQIALVSPKMIVCLGRIAATALIRPDFRITREHGKVFDLDGRPVLATFHPSALLRDPSRRPEAFMDLREIRRVYRMLLPSGNTDSI